MTTPESQVMNAIIQDAQDAIELATGQKVVLYYKTCRMPKPIGVIAEAVCRATGITLEQLRSKTRDIPEWVDARKIVTLLYYEYNGKIPYPVAHYMERERTSIMAQYRSGMGLLETDKNFQYTYTACINALEN